MTSVVVVNSWTICPSGKHSFSVPRWSRGKREFTVVIERDEEGYFVAEMPELPGCHTQAKSIGVLKKRLKEAIALCMMARPD